jgi:hypothetical protein
MFILKLKKKVNYNFYFLFICLLKMSNNNANLQEDVFIEILIILEKYKIKRIDEK